MSRPPIIEPRISQGGEDELARHSIETYEALEVIFNGPKAFRDKVEGRDMLIGLTDGGRLLTLIVEQTEDWGAYDVITGWDSSKGERTAWRQAK